VKFGLYMPNYGKVFGYAKNLANIAKQAENSGWDGFFIFDHILVEKPGKYELVDPWVALAAIAVKTEEIKFGTTVTPIPRRRPWKLARETVSIDHLSNGRLILSIGLGYPPDAEYDAFGEDPNDKVRGLKLDEGLNILFGLWEGNPFSYEGKYYRIDNVRFLPKPIQQPRIKVWGAGYWPGKAPFIRASKLDGIFPLAKRSHGKFTPENFKEIKDFIFNYRKIKTPFDIVWLKGILPKAGQKINKTELDNYEEVGVTWRLFYLGATIKFEDVLQRIRYGPPI
jgi:alkanesulfonate monooxygenase SsuD/methylene tetrahydromethanopterin reductase-like flavin-dependent oxidoreductase (luciferase family)